MPNDLTSDNSRKVDPAGDYNSIDELSFWTVTRKLIALIVILVAIGFSSLTFLFVNNMKTNMLALANDNYTTMTELLADSISGAIKWKSHKKIVAAFENTKNKKDSHLYALYAYGSSDGTQQFKSELSIEDVTDKQLQKILEFDAHAGKSEIKTVRTAEHLAVNIPLIDTAKDINYGHVIAVWDIKNINNVVSEKTQEMYLISLLCLGILALVLSYCISRGIGRRVLIAVGVAKEIAMGNFDSEIKKQPCDELGQLAAALSTAQLNLKAGDDSEKRATEFEQIKRALDSATAITMLIDNNQNIVYLNKVCQLLMNGNRSLLSNLKIEDASLKNLYGKSINAASNYIGLTSSEIQRMNQNHRHELAVNNLTLQVNVSPVVDSSNNRIGTVIEWHDKTKEVNAEQEVQAMVDAALDGDFSRRIDVDEMEGFYAQIANMLNKLAEISETGTNDTLRVLKALSIGQLDVKIENEHNGVFAELKGNCNKTTNKLTEIVGLISQAALNLNRGANEIASGNSDLSSRTEQQAAHLEETASAMEKMSNTVLNNSVNADQANSLAKGARDDAERGGEVANRAIIAVNEISAASKKIGDIIGVIDEIAFQTNLLALNASVEAARAGDKGNGFEVVASEVRELAGRCAKAANEIKVLIDDSSTKVAEGERLVGESGDALHAIVGSVNKVSDIISDIAEAGQEQTQGIKQINTAISQIDEMTQRNAALVEQAAANSHQVDEQAKELDTLVSFFTDNKGISSLSTEDGQKHLDTETQQYLKQA